MLSPLSGVLGPLWSPGRPALAPAGFDPASIAGLQLWLSADSGVYSDAGATPAADGSAVQQWSDRSSSALVVDQPTAASRPTYQAAGLNGRPSVRFGGSHNLALPTVSVSGPLTVFAACSRTSGVANIVPVGGTSQYNSVTFKGSTYEFGGNDGGGIGIGADAATGPYLLCWRRDASNICTVYRDDGPGAGGTFYGAGGFDFARVGSRNGNDNLYTTGDLAEILVYAADLTDADRGDVFAYLNARYALY